MLKSYNPGFRSVTIDFETIWDGIRNINCTNVSWLGLCCMPVTFQLLADNREAGAVSSKGDGFCPPFRPLFAAGAAGLIFSGTPVMGSTWWLFPES